MLRAEAVLSGGERNIWSDLVEYEPLQDLGDVGKEGYRTVG